MSDYFRHARIVSRSLEWARRTAPVPVGPNLGLSRDGIRFLDPIQAARDAASRGSARSRRRSTPAPRSPRTRCRCIQQHVDRYRAEDFFPNAQDRSALLRIAQAAAGPLRAAVGDARLRAARPDVPGVPGDLLARGARLLPQVHRRRAHAADDPQPRAARQRPTAPYRQRFRNVLTELAVAGAARARAAAARRRQVARRRPRARERADGRRRARPAARRRRTRARRCCSSSGTTCGCRSSRSAATPRIRRSSGSSPSSSAPRSG